MAVGDDQRFLAGLLTGEREKNYHHSRFRDQDWARRSSPYPRLRMHPRTAATLSLGHDEWVRIETLNGPGHCDACLDVTDRVPEGVVSIGMGWWYPEQSSPWFGSLDANINAALSYRGNCDPVVGSVDSRGLRCRVTRAATCSASSRSIRTS